MKILYLLLLFGFLVSSCDRSPPETEPQSKAPGALKTFDSSRSEVEVVPVDPEVVLPAGSLMKPPPIAYSVGDTFQGMWNYDRRNFTLRLTITSVDPKARILHATIQSPDLDNSEKQFEGTVGDDGRRMVLTGVAESGAEYDDVDGYHVTDLLRKGATQKVDLNDCDTRQLRGTTEDGTNLYFWTPLQK